MAKKYIRTFISTNHPTLDDTHTQYCHIIFTAVLHKLLHFLSFSENKEEDFFLCDEKIINALEF